jgi:hypothetical protein
LLKEWVDFNNEAFETRVPSCTIANMSMWISSILHCQIPSFPRSCLITVF